MGQLRLKKSKKVLVAMSSGVDSSVAAGILKKQGYDVAGFFLRFWKEKKGDCSFENKCCSQESYEDLKKICRILDIPLYVINAEKEFKREVVDYFLNEYKKGRTPNPCIVCNKEIKFKVIFKKMMELKADFIATGHYAIAKSEKCKTKKITKLFQSKDKEKDQSYFLYRLNQPLLKHLLFPVGEMKKREVRALAKKMRLPVFNKIDSQDICFIPDSVSNFLERNLKLKKGKIVDEKGNILGEHKGLPIYTIGQRKGINLGGKGPFFVIEKDFQNNRLVVSSDPERLLKEKALIERASWVAEKPLFPGKVWAKLRYRNMPQCAIIKQKGGKVEITFEKAQSAITPGQSAVFYSKKGEVIGGGIIR